jgi:hypothetical protein
MYEYTIGDLKAVCLFAGVGSSKYINWGFAGGLLFIRLYDRCNGAVSTLIGGFLGCSFASTTDAGSSKYINWGFAGGLLIRLYDRCMEQ